ncbi:hypothetical protein ACRARG_11240 [Pseudooceanicola sp. C21-150M6]|uniref:hypothetical protein n=1 Tax=Pseudooceanicola sp. C21-150M6 TaxID=3434355 RepID=UPI003D7F3231
MTLYLFAFLTLLTGPMLGLATMPAATDGLLLVIVPPWKDAEQLIAAAGAYPVGAETAPFGTFATGPDADLADRLKTAGAWAVFSGSRLAALCGWTV